MDVAAAAIVALPNENRTAKTDAVEAEIKKMGPKNLAALPGLDDEDFKVFGTLIQHFCFIERFRAKWIPVRVKKTRQNKNLELRF